jgi:succinyl-diaminopimelate desuccinylase
MPNATPADLKSYIQAHAADLQAYLSDLIRARSVNPPGDEFRPAKVLADFCRLYGIPFETYEKQPGRTNIVARIGQGRPCVLVPLHFDTVPAGDGWATDAFEPVVRDGRLFGRGVKDDKGPLAAMMLVARYFVEHPKELPGSLLLVGAADEETGSDLGVRYLLAECGLQADVAIVPDAGYGLREIDVGEKGVLFLKVRAVGKQAHGSEPERGVNALWPIIDFLNRIREWRPPATPSDLFTPPTLNLGAIHGGSAPNMVCGQAETLIDIRYLPGTDGEVLLEQLRKILREVESQAAGVRMDLEILSHQLPTLIGQDHPVLAMLERRTEEVAGMRPIRIGQSGATVAKFLILSGIPAVGFGCGPEGVEHMANEWIDLDELGRFAEVMGLVIIDLMCA